MNSEYALLKLVLQDPTILNNISKSGFKSLWFHNKKYAKAYDLIFEKVSRFNSIPTNEELTPFEINVEPETIPHTVEHCVHAILERKNKELMGTLMKKSAEVLTTQGSEAARTLILENIGYLPKLEDQERSRNLSNTTDNFLEDYYHRVINKGKILGIETGFPEFDQHVMGFMPQWLVVIAGRNGVGKSTVLASWAQHAFKRGKNIVVFSCEMSVRELETRIHSLGVAIPPRTIDFGLMDIPQHNKFVDYLDDVKNHRHGMGNIIVNDNPMNLENIKLELQQIKKSMPIDAVFIDAAYRMQAEGRSDTERMGSIARGCKDLAKQFEVPVVCTVQLNRDFAKANEGAKNKGKTLSGGHFVYGSDAWNQDADMVLSINQPEDYAAYNYVDLICDKFRHGEARDFMFHMNLRLPIVREINREMALDMMGGENLAAQQKTDNVFEQTDNAFQSQQVAVGG